MTRYYIIYTYNNNIIDGTRLPSNHSLSKDYYYCYIIIIYNKHNYRPTHRQKITCEIFVSAD